MFRGKTWTVHEAGRHFGFRDYVDIYFQFRVVLNAELEMSARTTITDLMLPHKITHKIIHVKHWRVIG